MDDASDDIDLDGWRAFESGKVSDNPLSLRASMLVGANDHAPDEESYPVIVEEQEAPSTGHDAEQRGAEIQDNVEVPQPSPPGGRPTMDEI